MDRYNRVVNFIISEAVVIFMITLNAVALFLDAFPMIRESTHLFFWIDYACVIFFLIEAVLKMSILDHDEYWDSNWNKFDLFVVMISIPCLLSPLYDVKGFSAILILRLGRLIRFFKLLRFVPDGQRVWFGILRALKASIAVFFALLLLNIVFGMGATLLFGHVVPEKFGNPLISCYSLCKVFTVDGWIELPDAVVAKTTSVTLAVFARIYFLFAVVICGVLGLSLANAVFVDEMTSDNTAQVEKMVDLLQKELRNFRTENQQSRQQSNDRLQNELSNFRDENRRDRQESNEKLTREIESLKAAVEKLTSGR
ncbi:MAG TPA: ion transporter [Candidatus Wallbacteria bacterium]|nr:ion transporter [Candidatus Wallbacteria bacterium]